MLASDFLFETMVFLGSPAQATESHTAGAFCDGAILEGSCFINSGCTLETPGSFKEKPVETGLISSRVQLACGDTKNLWVTWALHSFPSLTDAAGFNISGNYNKTSLICL